MSFVKSSIFCSVSSEKPLAAMAAYITFNSSIFSFPIPILPPTN